MCIQWAFAVLVLFAIALTVEESRAEKPPMLSTRRASGASNPFIPGYFADPSVLAFDGRFYLYATIDPWGADTLGCWESDDFKNWTFRALNWPTKKACTSKTSGSAMVWAPSVVRGSDGRFYMYVSVGNEVWVGRAEHPLGPWENALGGQTPLVAHEFRPGFHMIDAEAFIDDDGTPYLYWGSGWGFINGKCWAVRLKADMTTFDSEVKDVTPAHYFEAPFMIKRGGKYYLMCSDGNTTTDTYCVRYAVGDSPFGPFVDGKNSPILKTDRSIGVVSPGHHAIFRVGDQDYIVYHIAALPQRDGTLRQPCVDRLQFAADGSIDAVKPTIEGAAKIQAALAEHRSNAPTAEASPVLPFHTWAQAPVMGWNSWDCFGTAVTEALTKANADYMAEKLKSHGWQYLTVDIQWYEPNSKGFDYRPNAPLQMDGFGRLLPAESKFPSAAGGKGFKPLADYLHGKGLKFGIHLMRGIPRQAVEQNTPIVGSTARAADIADTKNLCKWNGDMYGVDMTKPGAQDYYNSVFRQIAAWDVDLVKVDDLSRPYAAAEIEAIRKAIDATGRPIVLSTSPGETPLDAGNDVALHANLWRISDDFWDNWKPLKEQFIRLRDWAPFSGSGRFPDADMLPLGSVRTFGKDPWTHFKQDEQFTLMTLWSIARSPLILGGNLPLNDAFTLSLITNDEVIAANQNGRAPRESSSVDGKVVWTSEIPGTKDRYVAVFNTRDRDPSIAKSSEAVPVRLASLGEAASWKVRDLWTHTDLPDVAGTFTPNVAYHGAGLYRLSPSGAAKLPESFAATATVSSAAGEAWSAARLTDSNYFTRWLADPNATGPQWSQLDLGKPTDIQWLVLRPEFATRRYLFKVVASVDGGHWRVLADLSKDGARGSPITINVAGQWRYVRIEFAQNMKPDEISLWEMSVG